MARILIVDDSPTETFRFREILTKRGFDVIEATNGADGVTMAQAELPDLILIIEINYSQAWTLLKNDLLIIYVIKSFC